jgi:hypothetical protein
MASNKVEIALVKARACLDELRDTRNMTYRDAIDFLEEVKEDCQIVIDAIKESQENSAE